MPLSHRLLAALVAVLWGLNFLAIHATLGHYPPFLAAAVRWAILAVPAVLLVPRPQVPWKWLIGYGLGFGTGQFAFLYLAMTTGMPTGLASLVLQSSAPFTVVLGSLVFHEHLTRTRVVGLIVAALGLGIVGSQRLAGAAWLPFALTLLGGLSWAIGNVCSREAHPPRPLHLMMWMAIVPPLPLLALSLLLEGPDRIGAALGTAFTPAAAVADLGLAYTVVIATVIGSGLWTWLMSHHAASEVAPWSMLVPVTGITAAWLVLGERPSLWEDVGCAVVVAGVLLTSLRVRRRERAEAST